MASSSASPSTPSGSSSQPGTASKNEGSMNEGYIRRLYGVYMGWGGFICFFSRFCKEKHGFYKTNVDL